MGSSDLVTRIVDSILPSAGALAGFALALIAFELNEWRKRLIQRNAIRSSLRAELRTVEVLLNSLVTQFAVGVGDMQTAIKEIRWLWTVGWSTRGRLSEMTPELQASMESKSDEELAEFFKHSGWHQRAVEPSIPLPVVHAVLSSPIAGLSTREAETLTMLKWQSHLLDLQARWMEQWFDFSFTIEDKANHDIAVQNHEGAKEWYRKRAGFMLDAVRDALRTLDDP